MKEPYKIKPEQNNQYRIYKLDEKKYNKKVSKENDM